MRTRWSFAALCAFFVAVAVAVAGCGASGIPSGSVASVAGNPISKRSVDHFMYVVDKGNSAESPGEPVIVPNDPPQFTSCIKQARAEVASVKSDSDTQLRSLCKQLFTSLSSTAMNYLITSYWYQAEAHAQGITVTDAQVAAKLTAEKKQNGIKTDAQFDKLLAQQGETLADINFETRVSLLAQKLEAKHSTTVSSAEIASYYAAHKSTFGTPASRNMRIVLASNAANAKAALAALRSGKSWGVVAKKYSTDPESKNRGGLLTDVTVGSQDATLTKAAFAAPLNKLVGPVKGSFGYYVIQVIKINPGTQESLAKATPQIKSTLTSTKQQAAATAVQTTLKKKYLARTTCATAYATSNCHGYKAPKTSSTSTAAATTPATTGTSSTASQSSSSSTTSTTSSH